MTVRIINITTYYKLRSNYVVRSSNVVRTNSLLTQKKLNSMEKIEKNFISGTVATVGNALFFFEANTLVPAAVLLFYSARRGSALAVVGYRFRCETNNSTGKYL